MRLQSTALTTLLWATATLAAPINNSGKPSQEVELPSTTHFDSQPLTNITADLQPAVNNTAVDLEPATNVTADGAWPNWACKKNFTEGTPLTKLERILMKVCYKELLKGKWLSSINCPRTDKTFQSWGKWWVDSQNCHDSCLSCIDQGLDELAANVICNTKVGLAKCHVQYM
ncbi:hypothetical protein Hte_003806 [Hypoxylon texense]